jgi:cardiolipin synthase A/B
MSMTTTDFTFYTSEEYWDELLKQFAKAKPDDRIAMIVMGFDPVEPPVEKVTQALIEAIERGVNVSLVVDAYTFLLNPKAERLGPLWFQSNLRYITKAFEPQLRVINAIRNHPNGHATIINKPGRPFPNPVAGRNHIKYTVINDRVFVGGCNLYHTWWLDLMVGWNDKVTADYLYDIILNLHRVESTKELFGGQDLEVALDADTALYIDSGKKNQSIIFKKALELIDSAEKSLIMTCQFFPNSITARHLAAAHKRGVDVEIIYAHPAKQGHIGGLGQQVSIVREKYRHPAELFQKMIPKTGPALHAKLIATEKGAIIGSHNYVQAGVSLGTAEIALLRYDNQFAKDAVAALKRELEF